MREDDRMTKQQVEEEIRHFKKVFQAVRLFKISDHPENPDEWKETEEIEEEGFFHIWDSELPCDACISRKAAMNQATSGKLEVVDGEDLSGDFQICRN